MTSLRSLRATALLALVGSVPAFGAAYVGSAYEGFNYASGNITNVLEGGTGWNAAGAGQDGNTKWGVTLAPGGNTVSSGVYNLGGTAANQQITSGGSALIAGAGQAGRNFGQNVDSGTFYFGYTVKKTDVDVRTVNFAFFGDAGSTANPTERFSIGQIANNTNLRQADGTADPAALTKANQGNFAVLVGAGGAQTGGTFASSNAGVYTAATEQPFTLGETFQIVGKIEFNYAGGNGFDDRLTVYINPGSLIDEALAAPYITLDKFNLGTLTGFRLFAGGNQTNQTVGTQTGLTFAPSAAEFDEIRLGTTYNAVTGVSAIPEPSSFAALAGLVGMAFAASRRRRA